MKVELIKIQDKSVGWKVIAESDDDKKILNAVRDLSFWGMDDTKIQYAGMTSDESENNVQSLRWIQKQYNQ
jgi:hypothetical protein